MELTEIIYPIMTLGSLGILFAMGLGIADKKFAVEKDERVDAIKEYLPGANCGGCGLAGCDAFATAVVKGEASCNGCPVSSAEQRQEIAKIMGQEVQETEPRVAYVKCKGTHAVARTQYTYKGMPTCHDAQLVHGGPKGCRYGCLGFGSCQVACSFGAITMEEGIAKINKDKCTSCGSCVSACPRALIEIARADLPYQVACASQDVGKVVKENCTVGCIGCGICMKQCDYDAVTVKNKVAHIDEDKCTACGKCFEKCPTKAIEKLVQ